VENILKKMQNGNWLANSDKGILNLSLRVNSTEKMMA